MAGLLAAEGEPVALERLEHVAVPDRGLAHGDAPLRHGQAQPEVGHDGDHHGVAGEPAACGEVDGEQRQQLVAGGELPGRGPRRGGGRRRRRGRGPRSAPCATTCGGESLGMRRTAAVVDVGRRRARRRWPSRPRPRRSRTVGATADAAPCAQSTTTRMPARVRPLERRPPGGRRRRRRRRPPATGGPPGGPPRRRGPPASPRGSGRARPRCRPRGVGQLQAAAANSLMPLSAKGLCDAETTAAGRSRRGREPGHAGRGQHAEVDDVGALAGQPGGQGRLQHRARAPGVAADEEALRRQDARDGPPEGEDQLGAEFDVGDPADAVGAEADRPTPTTASSTAAPCGPSSGRTSCSPSRARRA